MYVHQYLPYPHPLHVNLAYLSGRDFGGVAVAVASQMGFPCISPIPFPFMGIGSGTAAAARRTDDLASTSHLVRHWSRAVSLSACLQGLGFSQRPTRSRVVYPHVFPSLRTPAPCPRSHPADLRARPITDRPSDRPHDDTGDPS